jgi:apolipoprotein N-acyltransferase
VFLGLLAPFGLPLWRRRKAAWVRLALCLMFAVGLSGCNLKSLLAMTPPGTYTVTVNATSGKISHSMNLTVVVQ